MDSNIDDCDYHDRQSDSNYELYRSIDDDDTVVEMVVEINDRRDCLQE